jgi:drug/metabolite transporter (DMT)-like permease
VGSFYGGQAESHPSAGMAAGLMMIFGGAYLTLGGVVAGELSRVQLNQMNAASLLAFLYLLIFGSIIGFSAYNWLMKNASPAVLGTHTYVNPLVALVLGVTLAGETLTVNQVIGGLVILASVFLITRRKERQAEKVVVKELAVQEN